MKPSIFQANNVSKLQFSHFLTIKHYGSKSYEKSHMLVNNFFDCSPSIYMFQYNIERGEDKFLHTHVLAYASSGEELIRDIGSFVKLRKAVTTKRKVLVKSYMVTYNNKRVLPFLDQYLDISGVTYIGSKVSIYVESVVDASSAAYYSFKSNDYGLGTGFLFR